jgi:cobalt-zinc-cadmium efflux system membrane fusion protein
MLTRNRPCAAGGSGYHRLATVAALALLAACRGTPPAADVPATVAGAGGEVTIPEGSPLRTALSFDTVRTVELSDVVIATAAVESDPTLTVRLSPPLAGRVLAVNVQPGELVHKGEPLITLYAPDFTSAQADLAHAMTAYRQAKNSLAREHDLATYGIAAQREVEQAETDYSQAQGDLDRATAHLQLLGLDTATALKDQALVIRSPIDGRVTELSIGVGEYHNDPTIPVMTIADLATVWLTANVSEKDVRRVKVGDRAAAVLNAYPNDTLHGVVAQVGAVVDTATRMIKVRITLSNPGGRLKPGMFATVRFSGRPVPTVVVPATSLLQVRDSNYVFVETKPWTLQRRAVELGRLVNGQAVVREGVTAGQRIVARQVVMLQ